MTISKNLKNDLLDCLDKAGLKNNVVLCLEKVLSETEKYLSDNKNTILNRRQIIQIKNAIKRTAKKEIFELEKILLKLWWSRKRELNLIAAHLLTEVYSGNNKTDIENIKTLLWRVDNRILCNEVIYSLRPLVLCRIDLWKDVFREWSRSDFKWNRLMAILLIKETAAILPLQIPYLLEIVDSYMFESNNEIRDEVSKCLNLMTKQWDIPVIRFLDRYQLIQNQNTQYILRQSKI